MASTYHPDPRLAHPLIPDPENGLSRFPGETLQRVAGSLKLFANLIDDTDVLATPTLKLAVTLQLEGLARLVEALADDLDARRVTLYPHEIPIALTLEDRAKLEILALRRGCSVADIAASFVKDHLAMLRVETMT